MLGGDATLPFSFIAQRLISRLEFDWIRTAGSLGQHHALVPRFHRQGCRRLFQAHLLASCLSRLLQDRLDWRQHTFVRRSETGMPAHGA